MLPAAPLAALLAIPFAIAQSASPISLVPSNGWYGIDGNWSTLQFEVGEPSQLVNVLASTTLSEFWVVNSGGCLRREPLCDRARGNVFTIEDSDSWSSLGTWALGLEWLQYGGNGDYGSDSMTALTSSDTQFAMDDVITAAVNSTDYYTGFFGLGIAQGRFGDDVHESPLTQAVKQFGLIPSYSYGYTAGAYYKGGSGMPCSLTLGGYDESRFESHNTQFTLGQQGSIPQVLVRSISASVSDDGDVPSDWESSTKVLSTMDDSFEALVDSSTPFLWFPEEICDEFADAFGLTYNDTLNLYTLNDTRFDEFRSGNSFNFTFSLTSFDNQDDLGDPLNVPGLVNITINAAAFAQVLRYPFMEAIDYGEPSIPYFPLRRTDNSSEPSVIGRAFLQEAYMITRYDSGVFSLHQARFPDDPANDMRIQQIDQPGNSPFPPPGKSESASEEEGGNRLETEHIVGIVIGSISLLLLLVIALVLYHRRKRSKMMAGDTEKDRSVSSMNSEPPSTPLAKIISLFKVRKRSRAQSVHEIQGSESQPKEVGADSSHAVYELPAPMAPEELDGDSENAYNGDTELGTESSQNLTAYEATRRKLERQLRGPVPAYSPPENQGDMPTDEKVARDVSPMISHQTPDQQSVSANESSENSNSFPDNLPSPISPRADGVSLHSRTTIPPGPHSLPSSNAGSTQRSESSEAAALPASAASLSSPTSSAGIQRAPIDPSKVICLGALPENVSFPTDGSDGRFTGRPSPDRAGHSKHESVDTLGTDYTELETRFLEEEEARKQSGGTSASSPMPPRARGEAYLGGQGQSTSQEGSRYGLGSSGSQERIYGGELVHVPQLAERRFSWEEER